MRVKLTKGTKKKNDFFRPGGVFVPAAAGKYRLEPPPDLNEVQDERSLLEYDFPVLTVEDQAKRINVHVSVQTIEPTDKRVTGKGENSTAGGFIGFSDCGFRSGYQFNGSSPGHYQQLVPDLSYIDQETWKRLPQKDATYLSCVPAVVFYFLSPTHKLEEPQRKVSWFIGAGTSEGIVVDALHDRLWIYNGGEEPYCGFLSELLIDCMPGFTFDCCVVRRSVLSVVRVMQHSRASLQF